MSSELEKNIKALALLKFLQKIKKNDFSFGSPKELNLDKKDSKQNINFDEIDHTVDDLEKIEKPARPGQISSHGLYVADYHPTNKNLVWYYHPEHAKKIDNFIKENKDKYIQKFKPEFRPVVSEFFDNIMSDPKRHIVAAIDDPREQPKPRARHLKSLILGQEGVSLNVYNPNIIEFSMVRHGEGHNYGKVHRYQYRKQKFAASEKSFFDLFKNDNEDLAFIKKPHIIMSAERPMYAQKIAPLTHEEAIEHLKTIGESVQEVYGHYGEPERSIIIFEPKNVNKIKKLAEDLGQESIIESDGVHHKLTYLNGPHKGKNISTTTYDLYQTAPEDFYTKININNKPIHFKYNFDFDQLETPTESTEPLAASEKSIKKAIDEKSFNKLFNNHNKALSGYNEPIIDHEAHISYFNKSHQHFLDNVLYSPEQIKPISPKKLNIYGISPKVLYKVKSPEANDQEDTYMIKPYHLPNERSLRSKNKYPIRGWASLTTKKLFDAAGMGHMAEDIAPHVYKGVPIIISKFTKPTENRQEMLPEYSQLDSKKLYNNLKIAVIDYLTNNQDRHFGNILYFNTKPVAIDHDRNFQYIKKRKDPGSNFNNFVTPALTFNRNHNQIINFLNKNPEISSNINSWWEDHGESILNEFNKNLEFLKDPHLKEVISKNFTDRWNYINDYLISSPIEYLLTDEYHIPIYEPDTIKTLAKK